MLTHEGAFIKLMGGPSDGEVWYIAPHPAVSLPQQFRFLSARNGVAVWETYENVDLRITTWDTVPDGAEIEYHYIGTNELD